MTLRMFDAACHAFWFVPLVRRLWHWQANHYRNPGGDCWCDGQGGPWRASMQIGAAMSHPGKRPLWRRLFGWGR